ncbi:Pyruvate/Phosphoenolpyruvate kinase-like domain-containing protein [Achaetomium macrosporum]|uniref:Pyruvate/Phosphoenolpyruvate kinase-like domain-containing protein n=1 Tax=Achaetomium macrosporum TaxID=79813 RepID=A0AAN7HCE0_9PEZI|nr:Pyruvate/Phosphoenolpyruvate kinase-like domain-containing protein [Achaetomium macrosporum]
MSLCENVLYTKAKAGRLCKALCLRLVTNPLVIQFAKNAGFDVVWVEMEHSTFSLTEASLLSSTAMLAGITPIVRVPYECGMGYVQQVLDSGAMVVIFPHVKTAEDAEAAVRMCKFPPRGKRSLWLQQAAVGLRTITPIHRLVDTVNGEASAVGMMIETAESIKNIDAIAAVDGIDLLMVGCMDLSTDMGMPGTVDAPEFRAALEAVSAACRRHNKVFGLAGNYNNLKFQHWAINTLGARLVLCQVDSNIISVGTIESARNIDSIYVEGTALPNGTRTPVSSRKG